MEEKEELTPVQEGIKKSGTNLILILIIILVVLVWKVLTGAISPETFFRYNFGNGSFFQEVMKLLYNNYDYIIGSVVLLVITLVLQRNNQQWWEQEKARRKEFEEKQDDNNDDDDDDKLFNED
jgi:hypothetical protein